MKALARKFRFAPTRKRHNDSILEYIDDQSSGTSAIELSMIADAERPFPRPKRHARGDERELAGIETVLFECHRHTLSKKTVVDTI